MAIVRSTDDTLLMAVVTKEVALGHSHQREFHEKLGIPTEAMKIRARVTNKQALEIQGVFKGIYLRFPNIANTFFVKPLVVRNLSCNL